MKANYRKLYYENSVFRIEGTVCYDRHSETYIVNIEFSPQAGMGGLEIFNEEYDDYDLAVSDLDKIVKKTVSKIYKKVVTNANE